MKKDYYLLIETLEDVEMGIYQDFEKNKEIYIFKLFDFKKNQYCCGDSVLKFDKKYVYKTIDAKIKDIPFDFNLDKLIPISYKQFQYFKKMSFKNLSKINKKEFLFLIGLQEWAI